ncbi:MAG: oxaloacetate decarboxylase (Na+ extruding) subunit alpha [Pyrinomonadaceae bacterium]|jgi:acetyl-CoA carboxylase biotin carboxyl carrier protein|nr:oxaloacetate decarboxylase (Na+ extruding) subunit alpha [Pyrinomonadaceae bacterium]
MSDEQRPEEPAGGDQPNDSSGGTRQQSADARRSGVSSSSSTGTGGSSSGGNLGGGGGRHGARRGRHRGERSDNQPAARRTTETSINMDELRELADLIAAQGFTEFELEKEGFRLRLSRNTYPQTAPGTTGGGGSVIPFPAPSATSAPPPTTAASSAPAATTPAAPALAAADVAEDLFKIPSPIVGTFYRAPSPTSDVFVKQGSRVEPETVVCIIEAMKLMNEIQAEVSGTIEKIYVENGQPVEYGQALFGIRK